MTPLLQRTLAGDPNAWQELQAALGPTILAIARRHRLLRRKGLAASVDDLLEVRVAVFERLARDDFQNLRRFQERSTADADGSPLDDWLYGAVDFVIREHVRRRFGRAPKAADPALQAQPSKRDLQSHAGRLTEQIDRELIASMGMTLKLTVAQIFEHIAREFTPEEARALALYFRDGLPASDIAAQLSLADAKEAERLIRRLVARLRYRFVERTPDALGS